MAWTTTPPQRGKPRRRGWVVDLPPAEPKPSPQGWVARRHHMQRLPAAVANAAALVPTVRVDTQLALPAAVANAAALVPTVAASPQPQALPPAVATAAAAPPVVRVDTQLALPAAVAAATAAVPAVRSDAAVTPPAAAAAATTPPPVVAVSHTPDPAAAGAAAAAPVPGVTLDMDVPAPSAVGMVVVPVPAVYVEHTMVFDVAGAWAYTLPSWWTHVDVVLIGGAEAGTNGSFVPGQGGRAGNWNARRLARGVDAAAALQLAGTVGAGGASNGAPGGATTATWEAQALSAAGGTGQNGISMQGENAGNYTFFDVVYEGGNGGGAGATGGAPGGAGGGAGVFGSGGRGAPGRVWVRVMMIG